MRRDIGTGQYLAFDIFSRKFGRKFRWLIPPLYDTLEQPKLITSTIVTRESSAPVDNTVTVANC